METFSFENAVFAQFAFYAALTIIKMMLMSFATTVYRFKGKAFANPEDCPKNVMPNLNDPDVERVRRCHLNDIENVIPFVLLGLLYVASQPALTVARLHFVVFFVARCLHTVAYLSGQRWRGMAFFFNMLVNLSMAVQVVVHLL